MQQKIQEENNLKQKNPRMLLILLVGVMVLALGAFYVNSRYVFRYGIDGIQVDKYEKGTEKIDPSEDPDKGVDVPEGSFRVHINHLPAYDSNNGYNLKIWNPKNNHYLMRVKIVQTSASSTEKTLYATDLIRTGYKIENRKLNGAAEGEATAVFTAYDKKTLEKIGSTEVKITLPKAQ